MTKDEKQNEFIDRVSRLFLEMYGETEEDRPYARFIVHIRDVEDDKVIEGIGGTGCPVCATEELNTFILMKGIRHQDQTDAELTDLFDGEIPPNLRN